MSHIDPFANKKNPVHTEKMSFFGLYLSLFTRKNESIVDNS